MLEFGGMQSTPLLSSLPCPLCPGMVALDRVLSMSQIVFNIKTVLMLNRIIWNSTVYMNKKDLASNNLQWFIYHKTKLYETKPLFTENLFFVPLSLERRLSTAKSQLIEHNISNNEPPFASSYDQYNITAVFLQELLWH